MQKYILDGDPKEVAKVIQENRIRVERGVITITPVQPETALDPACIETLIESQMASEKECQRMAVAQIELAGIANDLVAIIVTSGQTIPDELVSKLDSFGVDVPKIAETVPKLAETIENDGESVQETSENVPTSSDSAIEPNTINSDAMDNKYIDPDEFQEVDLDTDDKTLTNDDSKDVPADDVKEAAPAKKTSKRSKKSE